MGIKNYISRSGFWWLVVPLVKLYYKLKLILYRQASKIGFVLMDNLKYQIMAMNPNARLEGYDEVFDRTVHIAVVLILHPELFGAQDDLDLIEPSCHLQTRDKDLIAEYIDLRTEVDTLVQKANSEVFTTEIKRDYWLLRNYIERIRDNEELAVFYLSRASKLGDNVKPLEHRDMDSLKRKAKKERRRLRNVLADRGALKIDISAQGIVVLISLVSSLFLVSGYLYNYFLLREFGIDVSLFFTLSDYVAASLSRLSSIFIGAFFAFLGYFLGVHSLSRKSEAQIKLEGKFAQYRNNGVVLLLFTFTAIAYYRQEFQIFYRTGHLFLICIALLVLPYICSRFFKRPIPVLCGFVFTASFVTSLWSSIGINLDRLKHEEITQKIEYDIKLRDGFLLPSNNVKLIAGNSGFFFFLDESLKPIILNRNQVDYLIRRQNENDPGGFFNFGFPTRSEIDPSP